MMTFIQWQGADWPRRERSEEEPRVELDLGVVAAKTQTGGDIFPAAAVHTDNLGGQTDTVQAGPGDRACGRVAVFVEDVVGGADTPGLEKILAQAEAQIIKVIACQQEAGLELDSVL